MFKTLLTGAVEAYLRDFMVSFLKILDTYPNWSSAVISISCSKLDELNWKLKNEHRI